MSQSVRKVMGSRRAFRVSSLVTLLGLGACTSVLGIEDLHEGPRPGSGGDGNNTAGENGAGKTSTGGTGNGGTGGSSNTSGTGNASGDGPSQGGASDGGAAGATDGGAGGAGGATSPDDPTVRGTVIDIWGNKLSGVPVQIGDKLVVTNAAGAFTVEDVPSTYDVSLDIEFVQYNSTRSFGWVYQGLTRRDPTLQVRWGQPFLSGQVDLAPPGPTYGDGEKIALAIGAKNGNTQSTIAEGGNDGLSVYWEGGSEFSGTAHALFLALDPTSDLPTKYFSHTSTPLLVNETDRSKAALTLTRDTLTSDNLKGTATWPAATDHYLQVFVHFDDHTLLRVVDDYAAVSPFTYLVPSLPKSTYTVAVSQGDPWYGESATVVADGISATSNRAFTMPPIPKLVSPATGKDMVTAETHFVIDGNGNSGPYVYQFDNIEPTSPYQTIFLVTEKTDVTIPVVTGGGLELIANNLINWRVATHGKYASVDEMAGPDGGLQPFSSNDVTLEGPPRDGGEYTISTGRTFTTAP